MECGHAPSFLLPQRNVWVGGCRNLNITQGVPNRGKRDRGNPSEYDHVTAFRLSWWSGWLVACFASCSVGRYTFPMGTDEVASIPVSQDLSSPFPNRLIRPPQPTSPFPALTGLSRPQSLSQRTPSQQGQSSGHSLLSDLVQVSSPFSEPWSLAPI